MAYVQPHVEAGACYQPCPQPCDPCDPRGGFVHTTPAYPHSGGGYVTYGGPQQPLHSVQAVPPQQRGTVPHTVEYVPVPVQATRGYAVQQVQEYDVCGNPVVYDPCAIPCTCAEDDERARRLAADRAAAAVAEQATRFESDNTKNMNELRAKLGLPPTTMLPGSEWDSVSPGNAAKIRELRDRIGVPDGRDVGTRSRSASNLPAKKKFELPEIDFDKLNATLNEPMPTYTPPVAETTTSSSYEAPPTNYARNIAPPMTFAVSPNAALNTTLPPGAKPQGDYNPYGYPITGQTYNTYAPAPATTQTYTAPPPSPPPRDYSYQAAPSGRKLTEWEKWDRREGMNPHMPSPEQLGQSSGDTSSYNRAMGQL